MTKKILERFGMLNLHSRVVPADPTKPLQANKTGQSEGELTPCEYPYKHAVGALLYLALSTRPDISYAVGQVAKYAQNPNSTHWDAICSIFAYLNGTKDLGIWLGNGAEMTTGYSDADFAGDVNDRSSTSGSIFFIHGGPVAWSSRKQRCISQSTTEAEYVASSEASKTAVWLRTLINDLTGKEIQFPILCDNQGAVKLVFNPEYHPKTKHISVRYHFIRKAVEEKKIDVRFVRSEDQLADIFTKPLHGPKFVEMRRRIGMGKAMDTI